MKLEEIWNFLESVLNSHSPAVKIRKHKSDLIEYAGTIEAMQGKQKVDGYYFSSIVKKPKDIRLYFFPIYTHVNEFDNLSDELRKQLKGKSCFHIKMLNDQLKVEITEMISKGIELYKQDHLI